MKLSVFWFVVCLSVCSLSAGDVDSVVDKILQGIKQQLIDRSKTTVELPDYSFDFTRRVLFFPMTGKVKASGVTLGDFSTLRRFGDIGPSSVTKNTRTGTLSVMVVFSFDRLLVSFQDFKMDFSLIHVNTPVDVQIESNRFALMVEMHLNESTKNCQTELGFAMVDHLGDFQVVLGDSGFFSPSVERVDDIVLDWLVPDIEEAVDSHIRPVAADLVRQYSTEICSPFL